MFTKMQESPDSFKTKMIVNNIEVAYSDLMELSQGGPETGIISLNGKPIPDYRFGGPILYKDEYIYAPVHIKKLLSSGFKIARINTLTLKVELLGKTRDIIFLNKIDDDSVSYFEDLNKTVLHSYCL